MKPILIIKTGSPVKKALSQSGDFDAWIIACTEAISSEFIVVEVCEGESLPELKDISGVIITGSPAMVTDKLDWSENSASWLREAVTAKTPVLGICYGHQLLAHALGGRVDYNPKGRQIGTKNISLQTEASNDELFADLGSSFLAHVSHMQSVIELPEGSAILACNHYDRHCAVRFSDRAWGVQFHPEFDEHVMLAYFDERKSQLQEEGLDVDVLLAEIQATPVARKLLTDFYRLIRTYSV